MATTMNDLVEIDLSKDDILAGSFERANTLGKDPISLAASRAFGVPCRWISYFGCRGELRVGPGEFDVRYTIAGADDFLDEFHKVNIYRQSLELRRLQAKKLEKTWI